METLNTLDPAIKDKLEKAESAEDVAAIVKAEADGFELSQEDAEKIWEKLQIWKEGKPKETEKEFSANLSLDELAAVSGGGYDRDWLRVCDGSLFIW